MGLIQKRRDGLLTVEYTQKQATAFDENVFATPHQVT